MESIIYNRGWTTHAHALLALDRGLWKKSSKTKDFPGVVFKKRRFKRFSVWNKLVKVFDELFVHFVRDKQSCFKVTKLSMIPSCRWYRDLSWILSIRHIQTQTDPLSSFSRVLFYQGDTRVTCDVVWQVRPSHIPYLYFAFLNILELKISLLSGFKRCVDCPVVSKPSETSPLSETSVHCRFFHAFVDLLSFVFSCLLYYNCVVIGLFWLRHGYFLIKIETISDLSCQVDRGKATFFVRRSNI